jgi:hypothetical protein
MSCKKSGVQHETRQGWLTHRAIGGHSPPYIVHSHELMSFYESIYLGY